MKLKEAVKKILIKKLNKSYSKQLDRRKVSYDTWVREIEARVSKDCSDAKKHSDFASGKETADAGQRVYRLFLQKNGRLSEQAYSCLDRFFAEHPEALIVYGDEDLETTEGSRENPWYKPCWSPDLYLSGFYPGSVIAVRNSCLDAIATDSPVLFRKPEEIRPILRTCIERAGGFDKGCLTILHCPYILFHVAEEQVWESYLASKETTRVSENAWNDKRDASDVSVIIPSKDNPEILGNCLKSLQQIPGLDIIVVDNGSNEENQHRVRELTAGMTYLYQPMDFNFSKMCNMGAAAAKGRFLLFLNDDIEACGSEWLYAMREKAAKSYVGAVGLKLYYPESIKIQHAGITSLPVGPVHKMQFARDDERIYFDRNRGTVNCAAVTGACLMIEKDKFREAGGFKETLAVAYNDVELGFALCEAGYHNVVINEYYAYHHESLSRGDDASKEKLERLQRERELLYQLHPAFRREDPYYPAGLSMDGLDSRIVPAYVHARNTVQKAVPEQVCLQELQVREDPCVFLGLDLSCAGEIKGYGVVLGDNNACYDRYVVLESTSEKTYMIKTDAWYRQDLEENMKDQQNVALCGFHLRFSEDTLQELQAGGPYRIGVMAVNIINKGKLLNWSGRYFL